MLDDDAQGVHQFGLLSADIGGEKGADTGVAFKELGVKDGGNAGAIDGQSVETGAEPRGGGVVNRDIGPGGEGGRKWMPRYAHG